MKLIECPRDAMQGLDNFVSTRHKVDYINSLLKVGFDIIDFGSFVSPKIVPQMRDTEKVLKLLDLTSNSELLAIVANKRGAKDASFFEEINYLGYPLSVSEIFEQKNTNNTIKNSLVLLDEINNICDKKNKKLVVYLSMAFGNPYDEKWSVDIVAKWAKEVVDLGVNIISLADTVGVSTPMVIQNLYKDLSNSFSDVEWGMHLHSNPTDWQNKLNAAYNAGCRRFDGAINGHGGCPLAKDKLVGNMPTEKIISFLEGKGEKLNIDKTYLQKAICISDSIFN